MDPITRRVRYFATLALLKAAYPLIPNPSRDSFSFVNKPGKPFVIRLTEKLDGQQIEDLLERLQEVLYEPFNRWTYDEIPEVPKPRRNKRPRSDDDEGNSHI